MDANLPFVSMVVLLVKLALAGIPAAFNLMAVWVVIIFVVSFVLGMLGLGLGAVGGR